LKFDDDRRLDDLAGRLGHEAAHAGKLLHLVCEPRAPECGHHVDRVDAFSPG